jgi:hypothetical protein
MRPVTQFEFGALSFFCLAGNEVARFSPVPADASAPCGNVGAESLPNLGSNAKTSVLQTWASINPFQLSPTRIVRNDSDSVVHITHTKFCKPGAPAFSATLCCVLNLNNLSNFRWPPKYLRSRGDTRIVGGNRGFKAAQRDRQTSRRISRFPFAHQGANHLQSSPIPAREQVLRTNLEGLRARHEESEGIG